MRSPTTPSVHPTAIPWLTVAALLGALLLGPGRAAAGPSAQHDESAPPPATPLALQAAPDARPPIDISPALRPEPEETAAMRRWHPLYRQRFGPVKESWAELGEALTRFDREGLRSACRELGRRRVKLDPATLLPAPDPTVDLHLKRTLADLDRVLASCLRSRWFELSHRLGKAGETFSQAAAMIRRYDLEP